MKYKKNSIGLTVSGFILFFVTLAFTISVAVLIFNEVNVKTNGNRTLIALSILGSILTGTILCTVADLIRRKIMVEQPVDKILDATAKIAKGDFSVKLVPNHSFDKFDEYDVIMDNINVLAEELSKNEILKTDFIANVSHEIKTPLAIIQNYATLLNSKKLDENLRSQYTVNLVSTVKRLTQLINNILKLNKLENRKVMPELTNFNLGESLRLCTLAFESKIEEKNIVLVCDIDDMDIYSSKDYLEIVWNNLISNAIKFTDANGEISVTLKKQNGFAVVTVSDTGVGMSKETGKRIFDKFYQGDTSHSSDGNGLGLALVKKVIDVLGGEIHVKSELNKGSSFSVKIGNADVK